MAPFKPPIKVDLNRHVPWYKNDTLIQVVCFLSFVLFYLDLSLYIAAEYYEQGHYFWFAFQLCFFYNYVILLFWKAVTTVVLTVLVCLVLLICLMHNAQGICNKYWEFIWDNLWKPLKISTLNLWPLSPLLGFNHLYPLCYDREFKRGIKDKFLIRLYITVLHELIRSGGSIVLQIYSLVEGYRTHEAIMIISLILNLLLFLKGKLLILSWCHSMINPKSITTGRKILQYLIVICEIPCIVTSFLALLRFNRIVALIVYLSVFLMNVLYTLMLRVTGLNTDELHMKNYCITMHDYLCLVCIRIFMVRKLRNF